MISQSVLGCDYERCTVEQAGKRNELYGWVYVDVGKGNGDLDFCCLAHAVLGLKAIYEAETGKDLPEAKGE